MKASEIREKMAPIVTLIRCETLGQVPTIDQTREATVAVSELVIATLTAVHEINGHLATLTTRDRRPAVFDVPDAPSTDGHDGADGQDGPPMVSSLP